MSRRAAARPASPGSAPGGARELRNLSELGKAWRAAAREREQAEAQARALAQQAGQRARAQAAPRHMRGLIDRPSVLAPRDEAADRALFRRSIGAVQPLPDHGLAAIEPPAPEPIARQRELDEQAALAESWSDQVGLEAYLLTDDGLSFRRPGIGQDVLNRLRRGHWALQGEIDLHGCRRDAARELLGGYIRESHRRGMRCIRVVHGKGLGSPGRQPVLKERVKRWLAQCQEVIAFAQATGPQGGGGALVVLLAGH